MQREAIEYDVVIAAASPARAAEQVLGPRHSFWGEP